MGTAGRRPLMVRSPVGSSGAPLPEPQIPAECGPAHRMLPDIAAALMWGPRGTYAATADHLIGLISNSELVLVVTSPWLSLQGWELFAVTTDRVRYVSNAQTKDALAQSISSMLWLLDADVTSDQSDRKCNLVDLERTIVLWFETDVSVEAVNTKIRWAVRVHTNDQPGFEKPDTDNVLEEFSRVGASRRRRRRLCRCRRQVQRGAGGDPGATRPVIRALPISYASRRSRPS